MFAVALCIQLLINRPLTLNSMVPGAEAVAVSSAGIPNSRFPGTASVNVGAPAVIKNDRVTLGAELKLAFPA